MCYIANHTDNTSTCSTVTLKAIIVEDISKREWAVNCCLNLQYMSKRGRVIQKEGLSSSKYQKDFQELNNETRGILPFESGSSRRLSRGD